MSYPQRSWDDGDVEVVAKRLWAGGVATALVAAGIAFVGVLIINSIFEVGIQTAGRSGALVDNASTVIPIAAGIAALASTALLHLLLMTTPRPASFFSAIAVLVIVVLILQVFLADGTVSAHIATGILYAAIGVAIVSMLSGVSATSVRPVDRGGWGGRRRRAAVRRAVRRGLRPHEPQPPYPPQNPYGAAYGDQRTQRYDPRGQGDQWQ